MDKRLVIPALLAAGALAVLHRPPEVYAAERTNNRGPRSRPRKKFKGYQRKGGRRK